MVEEELVPSEVEAVESLLLLLLLLVVEDLSVVVVVVVVLVVVGTDLLVVLKVEEQVNISGVDTGGKVMSCSGLYGCYGYGWW